MVRIRSRKRGRVRQHIAEHPRSYGFGGALGVGLLIQCLWDVLANDIAAYFQLMVTALFGAPPGP